MRIWGVLGGFVAASLTLGQAVTLDGRTMRVESLVTELSRLTGAKLRAGNVRDEIVFLRVQQRDLGEVRRILAATLEAEWTREGDTLVLHRSPTQKNASRQAFLRERADSIRKTLEAASTALDTPFDLAAAEGLARRWTATSKLAERTGYPQDVGTTVEALKHLAPGRRLLLRAMSRLGPERLAALGWGERIVLVANPNVRQIRLDPDFIAQFVREQNVWADAVERVGTPKMEDGMMVDNPFANTMRLEHVPTDLKVVVGEAYGDLPFRGQLFLEGSIVSDFLPFVTEDRKRSLAPVESERLTLKPTEREFLDRLRNVRYPGGYDRALSPELRAILADPVEHEPTGMVLDAFFRADAGEGSAVALISDREAIAACAYGGQDPSPRSLSRAFDIVGVTRESSEGWVRWRSKSAYLARTERIARTVLRDTIRTALAQGELDLRGWSELWFRAPASAHGVEFAQAMVTTATGKIVDDHELGNPLHLRFYGSLNGEQRRNLRDGRPLLGSSLSPDQLREFERVLYSDHVRNRTRAPLGADVASDVRTRVEREFEEGRWTGAFAGLVEPTTVFPNGPPKDMRISLAQRDFPRLWVYPSQDAVAAEWEGATAFNLGYNLAHDTPEAAARPKYYRVGASRVHLVIIEYPSHGISHDLTIKDKKVDARSKALREEELPEDLRNELAQARARAVAEAARAREAKRNDPPEPQQGFSAPRRA